MGRKAKIIQEESGKEELTPQEIKDYKKYEEETSINFNELEEFAAVFTCRRDWQKEIESSGIKPVVRNKDGSRLYYIPKECIRIPKISEKYDVLEINKKARKMR